MNTGDFALDVLSGWGHPQNRQSLTRAHETMAKPIPTPTETEIQSEGVEVMRDGKPVAVTPSQLRNVSQDVALALATKFGADRLAQLFDELAVATCITNGGREIPDNRTRLATAIYVANQILGTPIQRSEIMNVNLDADSAVGMEERLRNSPALRSMFRKMLDKVETVSE